MVHIGWQALWTRRRWPATLLVLAVMALFVRLGIWQIDRYQEQRALTQEIVAQWHRPPLGLQDLDPAGIGQNPGDFAYRQVAVEGRFDYKNQVALRGQSRGDQLGLHLLTPLVLASEHAVLVDRGWIPLADAAPDRWSTYQEDDASVLVVVSGQTVPSQPLPRRLALQPNEEGRVDWSHVDVAAISQQLPYDLLPFFIQQTPDPGRGADQLPIRDEIYVDSTASTHLSYAVQWFTFALILGFGYVMLMRYREVRAGRLTTD